jgi:selenide,water dikinase
MPVRLVLVGAGHPHVAVLRALHAERLEDLEVTVVAPDPRQFLPGLLPDVIGDSLPFAGATIDVAALAERAGARLRITLATGLDRGRREVRLGDGTALRYDVLSIAVGAGLAGSELPGVRTHALMVRPAAEAAALAPALDGVLRRAGERAPQLTVVGAGPLAAELALAVRQRTPGATVTLLVPGPTLLPGRPRLARRVSEALARADVAVRPGVRIEALEPGRVLLGDGDALAADGTVWATGPVAQPFVAATGLARDDAGFLRVDGWLRSVDDPLVFAAGETATCDGAAIDPIVAGPVLAHNLLCVATGTGPLRRYRIRTRPEFVATAPGRALVAFGPFTYEGTAARALKELRERRYLRR